MNNYGNTCYVNAILQSLFAIPSFLTQLLEFVNSLETVPIVISSLVDIINARQKGSLLVADSINKYV
jgi:ubiquitin C-terminal hydrolase